MPKIGIVVFTMVEAKNEDDAMARVRLTLRTITKGSLVVVSQNLHDDAAQYMRSHHLVEEEEGLSILLSLLH